VVGLVFDKWTRTLDTINDNKMFPDAELECIADYNSVITTNNKA